MKITALKTYLVPPRWLFLKIETDEGLAGWGEPVLEGHAETLAAKISEFSDMLVGLDPLRIEDIWQLLYRNGCYRGGPVLMSALAGINTALWDIKGRFHDVPIHELMGGPVRDRVRTYRWIGGDRPENLVSDAKALVAKGYSACKFNATEELSYIGTHAEIDTCLDRVSSLRTELGSSMDLALDFHGRVHAPMLGVLLKELEPLRPMFIEDPLTSAHIDAIADAAKATTIPLCVGERLHSRFDFRAVFEKRAASIINPDPAHCGGISEAVRIANMAEAYDVAVAPHCPLGPIALAACLQVDAICHNATLQEQSIGMHYNADGGGDISDYVGDDAFEIADGWLSIPQRPGLGIEINEGAVIEAAKIGHQWRAPIWRHKDGAIAEW